jgi:nicotinate phosphoribosyltransferase
VRVVSLVDYDNDVVRDSLSVARAMHAAFGPDSLAAVRVDTSETLVDVSLADVAAREGAADVAGVNPRLIRHLRQRLDEAGFAHVGIIVSGGFTPARMRRFEQTRVPVAGYGIGSSLLGHNDGAEDGLLNDFDFTADVVSVDGRLESKVGRGLSPNPRLIRLDLAALRECESERTPLGR